MTDEEFYAHFDSKKVGDQQKIMKKLGSLFHKKFETAMQKVMFE